jgi:type I restriction enzyme R subunit
LQTLDLCYSKFTPADFDLIISDECHRSIYNKFSDVLAYFDAVQIGLTATPANFIDRDTFKFFDSDGMTPTFLYDYDTAVKENYLADFNVYSAQTKFQRHGIKFLELSEEDQNQLVENGFNPEDINFEGTDLERKVTNIDTLRRQWEEFMEVCYKDASGQTPAKTIVFAVTHKHALRLKETFDKMYPEFGGKLAQVIDSKMERAKDLLTDFQKQEMPRIAISVDMLDTGFDFPEVMNLAFWKPVGSQIKFWQMIGRGTRHMSACERPEWLPNFRKDDFLIVDFWENFEHFDTMPKDEEKKSQQPILVTIFNTRLNKLKHFLNEQKSQDASRIKHDLRNDILKIPLESYTVRRSFNEVRQAWDDEYWNYVTPEKLDFLRLKVAPLLRFARNVNQQEAFFTSKMERLGLNKIEKKDNAKVLESIKEDVSLLPVTMDIIKEHEKLIIDILTDVFAKSLTLEEIADARDKLAPVMKYKQEKPSLVIELGLDDIIEARKWVIIKEGSQKIYIEEYRKKIEEKILKIASEHPVIQKIKAGEAVTADDLLKLEATLITEFTTGELGLTEDNMLKVFGVKPGSLIDFIKHILNIENLPSYSDIVRKAFDAFILNHNYNADQSRFLRAVQTVFMQRKQIDEADLYDVPFTQFGMNAVEKYFTEEEIKDIIQLTKKLAA